MIFRSHVIRRCAVSCLFPPSSCLLRGHLILSFVLFGIPLYVVSFVLYLLLPVPPFTFLHLIWFPVAFCCSTIFFVVCFKETSSSKKSFFPHCCFPALSALSIPYFFKFSYSFHPTPCSFISLSPLTHRPSFSIFSPLPPLPSSLFRPTRDGLSPSYTFLFSSPLISYRSLPVYSFLL